MMTYRNESIRREVSVSSAGVCVCVCVFFYLWVHRILCACSSLGCEALACLSAIGRGLRGKGACSSRDVCQARLRGLRRRANL